MCEAITAMINKNLSVFFISDHLEEFIENFKKILSKHHFYFSNIENFEVVLKKTGNKKNNHNLVIISDDLNSEEMINKIQCLFIEEFQFNRPHFIYLSSTSITDKDLETLELKRYYYYKIPPLNADNIDFISFNLLAFINLIFHSVEDLTLLGNQKSLLEERLNEYIGDFSHSIANSIELKKEKVILEERLNEYVESFAQSLVTSVDLNHQKTLLEERLNEYIESFAQSLVTSVDLDKEKAMLEERLNEYIEGFSHSLVTSTELKMEKSILEKRLVEYIGSFSSTLVDSIKLGDQKKVAEDRLMDYIGNFSNSITESIIREKLVEEFLFLSMIDPLTRLYNRRSFFEIMENEKSRSKRNNLLFSCLMIDIDYFKNVNDTYGHLTGDYVLKRMAEEFKSKTIFRESDIIARYGGEEFIVLLPETDEENARLPSERFRKHINEIVFVDKTGKEFNISVSIGISHYRPTDENHNDIVMRADKALYTAKHNGRNQVVVYNQD